MRTEIRNNPALQPTSALDDVYMEIGANKFFNKVFQSENGPPSEILKQKDIREKEIESHLSKRRSSMEGSKYFAEDEMRKKEYHNIELHENANHSYAKRQLNNAASLFKLD